MAQNHGGQCGQPSHRPCPTGRVADQVSNLTVIQKKRLENISKDSKERVDKLRAQQKLLRDSIHHYLALPDDQSAILYPLFEREAWFQSELSKEYYRTRVKIDEVLTDEQRAELKNKIAAQRKKKK